MGYFMAADDNKKKALELAISHIEKHFGEGSIMTLGKHQAANRFPVAYEVV